MKNGDYGEYNKELYDQRWIDRAAIYSDMPGIRFQFLLIKKCVKAIKDQTKVNSVLDIGCGEGTKTAFLKKLLPNANVLGIDFSREGIAHATTMYANFSDSGMRFRCINAKEESAWEKSDLVTSFEVLEHLEDWQNVLSQMCSSSNKYIMIAVPAGKMYPFESEYDGHVRCFKRGVLEAFLRGKGFKPVEVYYAGFPFLNPLAVGILHRVRSVRTAYDGAKIKSVKRMPLRRFMSVLYNIMFFLFYCSSRRHLGRQFTGLFERE